MVDTHQLHELPDPAAHFFAGELRPMDDDSLRDLRPHRHSRIQRRHGILKHHGKRVSPKLLHLLFRQAGDLFSIKQNAPALDPRRFREQLHNRPAQNAFSAAGLAHDRQRFPFFYKKTHVPHGFRFAVGRVKTDRQIFYLQ